MIELLPASMKVADMKADNPGTWLTHCHVAEHMLEGMFARYTVHPKGAEGVSRDPGAAFFGTPQAAQSLTLRRAEITQENHLELAGSITVFEAFSVFNQTITVDLGGKSISFKPDRSGLATTPAGTLRIRNANRYGIIFGGLLEFEISLKGRDWQSPIQRLQQAKTLPVKIQAGEAKHMTTVRLSKRN